MPETSGAHNPALLAGLGEVSGEWRQELSGDGRQSDSRKGDQQSWEGSALLRRPQARWPSTS